LRNGQKIQRFLCRDCGSRFTEPRPLQENHEWRINSLDGIVKGSQLCAKEAKKLETATETKTGAGESPTQQTAKGKIIEHAFWMQKEGYAENTISRRIKILSTLIKREANLFDPESVKTIIAKQQKWSLKTKELAVEAYSCFLRMVGGTWKPPKYKAPRTLPFIPTEQEVNQLIAGCNNKTSTFLQLLKETAVRFGEAWQLKWTDFDFENKTVRITPEKGSEPRQLKMTDRLIAMLSGLPKDKPKPFQGSMRHFSRNFRSQRKRIATRLKNDRMNQIHFHTLRHWKATTEFAKTHNLIYVQQMLGHKSILTTQLYIQLVNNESDDYHSATAKNIAEAQKLVEAGFEYVCDFESVKLFRKRK
jgi:integrase